MFSLSCVVAAVAARRAGDRALQAALQGNAPHASRVLAVLIGTVQDGVAHVNQLEFGRNVRAVDPVALEEFYDTIIIGLQYQRGYAPAPPGV
jgi:hypothetical protein